MRHVKVGTNGEVDQKPFRVLITLAIGERRDAPGLNELTPTK